MLCPEVWNFNSPKTNSYHQFGNYNDKTKKTLDKAIKNSFFNQMVSIILPGFEAIPKSLENLIETSDYYLVKNLSLNELIRKDFVEAFVKRGKFTGISIKIDCADYFEDIVYLTPDGKLNLIVHKDFYQTLGLEGRSVGKSKERFEITIDLKNNNFIEQPKLYNRIKNALSNPDIGTFDFQLTWQSIDSTICPSSIAKFFKDIGYKVEQHGIEIKMMRTKNTLTIPNEIVSKNQIDSFTAHQVADYLAFIMLECDTDSGIELNSYCPSLNLNIENGEPMECIVLHLKGLMSSDFVAKLLETLSQVLSTNDFKTIILNIIAKQLPSKTAAEQILIMLNDNKYFFFTT